MIEHADNIVDLNAILHPGSVYDHPRDVLADQTISIGEKRAILASWASDAAAVISNPALREGSRHVVTMNAPQQHQPLPPPAQNPADGLRAPVHRETAVRGTVRDGKTCRFHIPSHLPHAGAGRLRDADSRDVICSQDRDAQSISNFRNRREEGPSVAPLAPPVPPET